MAQDGGSENDPRRRSYHRPHRSARRGRYQPRLSKLGIKRERQVREKLEEEGYAVVRAAGSLGCIDLVAGKSSWATLAIEVKADDEKFGPFNNFGPGKREALLSLAEKAGWVPVLAWWPSRGKLRWIKPTEWP